MSCMAARGEEEAGGKRESAMCSQPVTLRGAAVGAVWNGSNVRTTKVREGQIEGDGMTTAQAGRVARRLPSHSNLLDASSSAKESAAETRQMERKRKQSER